MILYINACVREGSRTKRLADKLIEKLTEKREVSVEEIKLSTIDFPVADGGFVEKRDALIASERFDDPMFAMARRFAEADEIVIAAPYWDMSFPAALKQYIEQINVTGITFRYSEEGIPAGLCKAKKLWYVMTAGGTYVPEEFGFGYVKALAQGFYGIEKVELVKAAGLDIVGANVEEILITAENEWK